MINLSDLNPSFLKALFEPPKKGFESRFTVGETLQGWVAKSLGPERALIRLRGMDLAARTPRPLTEGQPILVKVEQLKPQFVVSLLPNDTPVQEKTAALLRLYVPAAAPMGAMMENLARLAPMLGATALRGSGLEKFLDEMKKEVKNPEADSKNILQMMGLFHESELARGEPTQNLKRALLVVRQNLERLMEKEPRQHREALKKINDALASIELKQIVNAADNRDVKSWPIPYWNGAAMDTARLYIGRDDKEKGKARRNETVRVTLLLKMSRLGEIRAEAFAYKERMEGTIYAGSDAAVAELEQGMGGLVRSLAALGFKASFTAQRASRDYLTRQLEPDDALPVKSLLNLRA